MPEFWRHSGFHLLERLSDGRLHLTDDFLRAYLGRPEIHPVPESCEAERQLHAALLLDPRMRPSPPDLERIRDADVRDNYRVLLGFFDRLQSADSIEACYAALFAGGDIRVPPLFIDQLAHVIVRSLLDESNDPFEARAAELFFREQRASVRDGQVLLADLEMVDMHAGGVVPGNLGRLIAEARAAVVPVELDVLDSHNAERYWERDERHDFVLALNHNRPGSRAFCRLLERWIGHFSGVTVRVSSVRAITDERWAWHIGLDAVSTAILNELWQGQAVEPGRLRQLLALFRMDFDPAVALRPEVSGRPVYLALGMNEAGVVRMKPQNLLSNLPLASAS